MKNNDTLEKIALMIIEDHPNKHNDIFPSLDNKPKSIEQK